MKHTYRIPPAARSASVMLVMVGEGEVWVDEVRVLASEKAPSAVLANLLPNGGFEDGSQTGWQLIDNSGRARSEVVSKPVAQGRHALHLSKTGGTPFDVLRSDVVGLHEGQAVRVSARVRGQDVGRAFFKFFAYDDRDESLITDVDIARLSGSFDWRPVEKTYDLPEGTQRGAVMIVHVLGGELWLDDVRVELVAGADPARDSDDSRAAVADSTPPEPLDRRTASWLDDHAVKIDSLRFDAPLEDLAPLEEVLAGVRLVQLGEQTHGDGATFAAKARLVRFLHERLGFDVLAFESGLYECERANRLLASGASIDEVMLRSVFGIWRVSEVRPLFEYLAETHQTDRPLRLSGFDLRGSGTGAQDLIPEVIAWLEDLEPVPAADRQALAALDAALNEGEYRPEPKLRAGGVAALERLRSAFEKQHPALIEEHGEEEIGFLGRCLESYAARERFELGKQDEGDRWRSGNERDSHMADHLLWLAKERYPDRKIIAWGATFHFLRNADSIRKDGERFYRGCRPMGEAIHDALKDSVYTIGFLSHHGRAGMPWASQFDVPPPRPDSLEDQLHRYGTPHLFVDLRRRGPWRGRELASPLGYSRDFQAAWGKVIDGFFFIDEMHPSDRR